VTRRSPPATTWPLATPRRRRVPRLEAARSSTGLPASGPLSLSGAVLIPVLAPFRTLPAAIDHLSSDLDSIVGRKAFHADRGKRIDLFLWHTDLIFRLSTRHTQTRHLPGDVSIVSIRWPLFHGKLEGVPSNRRRVFRRFPCVHAAATTPAQRLDITSLISSRRSSLPRKGCRHIRSATNTYFPQVARVVSVRQTVDELARRIEAFWSVLEGCTSLDDIRAARRFNPALRASLDSYSDEAVHARLQSMSRGGAEIDVAEDPRIAEFQLLASGAPLVGANHPGAHLHAETLDRSDWDPDRDPAARAITSLVAVHRLREVACLYGFTRFEPAPLATDELEDVGLAVSGAPLAQTPDWLPAVEQFGEGFFLQFSPEALANWLSKPDVLARARQLQAGATAWINAKRAKGILVSENSFRERERPEYVMAHSIAHALMTEVAIDCGYPASALKERLYAFPPAPGQPLQCGILIYTATAGNQGSLGGLVEVTRRFVRILKSALERQRLCSGDLVCADHDPVTADEDRTLHGAACHGCLLVAETSREARNLFLDRALIVDTVGRTGSGFF
jgi:hypothetical protein